MARVCVQGHLVVPGPGAAHQWNGAAQGGDIGMIGVQAGDGPARSQRRISGRRWRPGGPDQAGGGQAAKHGTAIEMHVTHPFAPFGEQGPALSNPIAWRGSAADAAGLAHAPPEKPRAIVGRLGLMTPDRRNIRAKGAP